MQQSEIGDSPALRGIAQGDRALGGQECAAPACHPHPAAAADRQHWSCQTEAVSPGHGALAFRPVPRQSEEQAGLDGAHLALHYFHAARNARRTDGHPACCRQFLGRRGSGRDRSGPTMGSPSRSPLICPSAPTSNSRPITAGRWGHRMPALTCFPHPHATGAISSERQTPSCRRSNRAADIGSESIPNPRQHGSGPDHGGWSDGGRSCRSRTWTHWARYSVPTCRNNRAGCRPRCRSPSLRWPGGPRSRVRYCTHRR